MKICIPTVDDRGIQGTASYHFGSAPFFTVVDVETEACEVIPNGGHGHGGGACVPVDLLKKHALDAVACLGMGRGAMSTLSQAGIDVLLAESNNVAEIVEAARNRALRPLPADHACGGHQHGTMEGQGGCQHGG
jgi:predicted Fe-Mo cluster-binding NifX family protein